MRRNKKKLDFHLEKKPDAKGEYRLLEWGVHSSYLPPGFSSVDEVNDAAHDARTQAFRDEGLSIDDYEYIGVECEEYEPHVDGLPLTVSLWKKKEVE